MSAHAFGPRFVGGKHAAVLIRDSVFAGCSDRLASRFGISRRDQDEFAMRSHLNAAKAHKDGLYKDEIVPVNGSVEENGVRADSNMEKLSSLKVRVTVFDVDMNTVNTCLGAA